MTQKIQAHVSEIKKQVVQEFVQLIKEHPVIAIVDVENLPAKQLMDMRSSLRGKAHLRMTKHRLMNLALEQSGKKGIEQLAEHFRGMPAMLFSKDNPFTLFKILKKSKSAAPIKAGQITPKDVLVKAGGTNFAPGPIIGELGAFGIKAGIEGGKVAIKEDKIVAKEGDIINAKLAGILQRLEIYPMEIGLNLTAAYENGQILTKSILDIDEDAFLESIKQAYTDAFKLTLGLRIPTKENINMLIQNAHKDASALAIEQMIMTSENKEQILAKAEAQATSLKNKTETQ
ncbi:50S ribosomal protein L10 [Candidatus Woesearchaeota archaeon]|nr:50S ribosomal protein L10 [Candidatus Woesearchaeota archaeon]